MKYYKYLRKEKDWSRETYPPSSLADLIPGKRGNLFSTTFVPAGKGPHPVVLICHGIPGNEKLLDFGMALQEAGFCAISFHYSGSWGSDGDYSIKHCFEDASSVADFVLENERGLFSSSAVYVLGHSLGGLVACHTMARRKEIKAGTIIMPYNIAQTIRDVRKNPGLKQKWEEIYENDFDHWLRAFSLEELQQEASTDLESFDLAGYGYALAQKPLLTIEGKVDGFLNKQTNMKVLRDAIEKEPENKMEKVDIYTDHGMNMNREVIKAITVDFFSEQNKY